MGAEGGEPFSLKSSATWKGRDARDGRNNPGRVKLDKREAKKG